jgi:hypothetical protein
MKTRDIKVNEAVQFVPVTELIRWNYNILSKKNTWNQSPLPKPAAKLQKLLFRGVKYHHETSGKNCD